MHGGLIVRIWGAGERSPILQDYPLYAMKQSREIKKLWLLRLPTAKDYFFF
jgi:hypothetical protein